MWAPMRSPGASGKEKRMNASQQPPLIQSSQGMTSLQSEIHRHRVIHIDRFAAIRGRAETPATDRATRLIAESVRQVFEDLQIVDGAVAAHDAANDHRSL